MKRKYAAAAFAVLMSIGGLVAPALASPSAQSASVQTANGKGVVTAIDSKAVTITIKHEPIAALKWPAMTMTFKVKNAALLTGITVGEKVGFELTSDNGKPIVTKLAPRT